MADYSLQGSYNTVQVLSPTLVNNVVYCTIKTFPSGVIASIPVDQSSFDSNAAGTELALFAAGIETVMAMPMVIAGVGEQSIDPSGLLSDNVVFTVQYVSANTPSSGVTAEATVPVGLLGIVQGSFGQGALAEAEAIVNGVYANLQSAAGSGTAASSSPPPPTSSGGPNPSGV